QFCIEFPEVSRVLNHVPHTADDTAQAIFSMYRRHAYQVGEALDAQGRLHFSRLRRGELSANCLISIMGAGLRRAGANGHPEGKNSKPEGIASVDGLVVNEET